MNVLETLCRDALAELAMIVAMPSALRQKLKIRPEVNDLRQAITQNAVTQDDIELFVQNIMRDFVPGTRFIHEPALAALSVAIEYIPGTFAQDLLEDLSRTRILEMPLSPRVAEICLQKRRTEIAGFSIATYILGLLPSVEQFSLDSTPHQSTIETTDAESRVAA